MARFWYDVRKVLAGNIILRLALYYAVLGLVAKIAFSLLPHKLHMEAVDTLGPGRGFLLAARRIARCGPWGGHGIDPVPERRNL